MPTYEKVVNGRVVERVTPVDGDHEDTRLGCAAIDGADGWRVVEFVEPPAVDELPPAEPPQDTTPKPRPTPPKPKPKPEE